MRICYIRPVLFAVAILFCSLAASTARAQVVISVAIAPPELPVYDQPVCPGDGYIWTPGYWAWDADGDDYYWVPGTWVEAPEVGFFWTPPYWGWGSSAFIFHEGYWGPHIGFYGGINYGFGYFGEGFEGGRWEGGHFFYNRAVTNVNVTIVRNVYETRVNETRVTRVSYNGGRGGIEARPSREQETYDRERHVAPVAVQQRHIEEARSNRELRASVNHGAPPVAATPKPGAFNDHTVSPARGGGNARAGENIKGGENARGGGANNTRSETTPGHANPAVHAKDLQPIERHTPQPTGNAKVDQKYQKQQQQLSAKQDQERQKLQQKQEQEHQRYTQQKATEARTQQLEQKHQQQTQQLQQHHVQQQQHLEQRQQPQPSHQASAPKEKR
jgi:hypothetical protein